MKISSEISAGVRLEIGLVGALQGLVDGPGALVNVVRPSPDPGTASTCIWVPL